MQNSSTISDLTSLVSKRQEIEARRSECEAKVAVLRGEIRRLRQLETELDNAIHAVRIRQDGGHCLTSAKITARSVPRLKAWTALHRELIASRHSNGTSSAVARTAIRSAIPSAPDATIRSYLHRFKKFGLLEQHGNYWRLTERGRSGNPDEGAE